MKKTTDVVPVTAAEITDTLVAMRDEAQRANLMRFFKTGKGEYGEGDQFLGIKVPQTRMVVRAAKLRVPLDEISELLGSEWHEVRLCGFLLLVEEMKSALPKGGRDSAERAARRQEIVDCYLKHAHRANNWDLVDLSCPYILGTWLLYPLPGGTLPSAEVLHHLAGSPDLWEQRISVVSTLGLVRGGRYEESMLMAEKLLGHSHDLIHKAVGWILREVGKRDIELLREFLEKHAATMPRTSLRYAIERMDHMERMKWMERKHLLR